MKGDAYMLGNAVPNPHESSGFFLSWLLEGLLVKGIQLLQIFQHAINNALRLDDAY
jgi:hypothetical protein